jgi:putative transposase
MPECRRNRVPGGTFFFTVNLLNRRLDLSATRIIVLRHASVIRAPFPIAGWVVLPNHMHCLWTLPKGDADFPGRWRAIKTAFSKSVPPGGRRSPVMASRGERGIWQRRYWEHPIRGDQDFAAHLDYIHLNSAPPPRAGREGWGRIRRIGRILRFADVWPTGSIRQDGWAVVRNRGRQASSGEPETAVEDGSRRNALCCSAIRLLAQSGSGRLRPQSRRPNSAGRGALIVRVHSAAVWRFRPSARATPSP